MNKSVKEKVDKMIASCKRKANGCLVWPYTVHATSPRVTIRDGANIYNVSIRPYVTGVPGRYTTTCKNSRCIELSHLAPTDYAGKIDDDLAREVKKTYQTMLDAKKMLKKLASQVSNAESAPRRMIRRIVKDA